MAEEGGEDGLPFSGVDGEIGGGGPVWRLWRFLLVQVGEDGGVGFNDVVRAGTGFLEEGVDNAHAVADVEDAQGRGGREEGGGAAHDFGFPAHHDAVLGGVENAGLLDR